MVDEATRDGRSPSRFDRWASWIIAAGTWITVVNRLSYDERSAFWFQITVTMAVLLTAFAIYTEVKFRCARRLSGEQPGEPLDDESPDETRQLTRTSPRRLTRDRGSLRDRR